MLTVSTSLPIRLLRRAQSTRISLPRRLRALGLMAQGIDQSATFTPDLTPVDQQTRTAAQATTNLIDIAALLEEAAQLVHAQLLPRIQRYRVQIVTVEQLTETQRAWLWDYFVQQIYPLLTPLAIDSGRPFPAIQSRRLNFLVVLQATTHPGRVVERYGVVQIPARLPRLIQIEPAGSAPVRLGAAKPVRALVWREEIVRYFLPAIFSGTTVTAAYQFRLLRANPENMQTGPNTTLQPQSPIQTPVVRLDIEKNMPPPLRRWLIDRLHLSPEQVLSCTTPLGLGDLCELAKQLKPY